MIDIQNLLFEYGISFRTQGKNIGVDWTGVDCPICGDTRNHCGINPDGTSFSCFSCGGGGKISTFLKKVSNKEYSEIYKDLKIYRVGGARNVPTLLSNSYKVKQKEILLPGTSDIPDLHKAYIEGRGIDSSFMERYNCSYEYLTGDYKYRVIIPIVESGVIVNFVARDVTGKQTLRYKYPPSSQVIQKIGNCIFNIDNILRNPPKKLFLTEGVFDAIKIEYLDSLNFTSSTGSLVVLGTVVTKSQIRKLIQIFNTKEMRGVEKFILFDKSRRATEKGRELCSSLQLSGVDVKMAYLTKADDPGELKKLD